MTRTYASLGVAVIVAVVAQCAPPDPTPAPTAVTIPVTVYTPDPPFVADAAGVPIAAGDAATGDGADVLPDASPSPAASIVPGPAGTTIAGRCSQWEPMLAARPGWDVARMSKVLWRESRCFPDAFNRRTHDRGLGQVHWSKSYWSKPMRTGFGPLAVECGLRSVDDLFVPEVNVSCMYALYRAFGYRPWGTR